MRRLQLEIEFNRDRGTSDNCFVIKGASEKCTKSWKRGQRKETLRQTQTDRSSHGLIHSTVIYASAFSFHCAGEKATALIDVPDNSFAQAFSEKLKKAAPTPRRFQFIVLGHFSPRFAPLAASSRTFQPGSLNDRSLYCFPSQPNTLLTRLCPCSLPAS